MYVVIAIRSKPLHGRIAARYPEHHAGRPGLSQAANIVDQVSYLQRAQSPPTDHLPPWNAQPSTCSNASS